MGKVPEGCKVVSGLANPNYITRSEWISASLQQYWKDYYAIKIPSVNGYKREECSFYSILLNSDGTVSNIEIDSNYSTGEILSQKRGATPSWPKVKYLCIAKK